MTKNKDFEFFCPKLAEGEGFIQLTFELGKKQKNCIFLDAQI
jgi:hypothetical protein